MCVCACVSFRPNRSSHTGTRGSSSCLASFLFALFRLRSPSVTRWVSSLPRAARPSVGAEAGGESQRSRAASRSGCRAPALPVQAGGGRVAQCSQRPAGGHVADPAVLPPPFLLFFLSSADRGAAASDLSAHHQVFVWCRRPPPLGQRCRTLPRQSLAPG